MVKLVITYPQIVPSPLAHNCGYSGHEMVDNGVVHLFADHPLIFGRLVNVQQVYQELDGATLIETNYMFLLYLSLLHFSTNISNIWSIIFLIPLNFAKIFKDVEHLIYTLPGRKW